MSTATKTRKQLSFDQIIDVEQVTERYSVYTVLSSDGSKKYHVTANADGVATGCDCPASLGSHKCYHRTGVESYIAFEQAWNAPIAEPVVEETARVQESMTVAEFTLGKAFAGDLDAHVGDEFSRENAVLGSCGRRVEMGPNGYAVPMAS